MQRLRIRSASAWTMLFFGIIALILGAAGIVHPQIMLQLLGFPDPAVRPTTDFTLTFIQVSAMASFNIGVYYILGAFANLKQFFLWTVPFRGVTFTVFTTLVVTGHAPVKFLGIPIWELTGAICTGLALLYERNKARAAALREPATTTA